MTPQEEAEVRVKWRQRRTMKGMARLARWKERETMKMIAPDHRRWCVNTSKWYDDREGK